MTTCPICSQLRDVQMSFYKYAAPEYDVPLPAAAAQLRRVCGSDAGDPAKFHVRCCPQCGALYTYRFSYEYIVNGSEDEEELARMAPAQAADFVQGQVRRLEAQRREIERLERAAGDIGDFIDHGAPPLNEAQAAIAAMQAQREQAAALRQGLEAQVAGLRDACPAILSAWAQAHIRVCQTFLDASPEFTGDDETARSVAQSTLEAWERLPESGPAFISVAMVWMEGYLKKLEGEMDL